MPPSSSETPTPDSTQILGANAARAQADSARLTATREALRANTLQDEAALVKSMLKNYPLSQREIGWIEAEGTRLVRDCRARGDDKSILDAFLQQFGLSNSEGVALMCLAEALLRVPDADTADELIAEKVLAGDWDDHLRASDSVFVNASTWALMLTGKVISLCLLYTSPSPRDRQKSRMPSSA